MKKRTLSLFLALVMAFSLMVVPAFAADTSIPGHGWIGCSNEPIRTEDYTTASGFKDTLYVFPEGTTFFVAFRSADWSALTAYDPSEVGVTTIGQDYVFYSETERFAPEPGKVYHLVVSDTMDGQECYIELEEGTGSSSEPEEPEPASDIPEWLAGKADQASTGTTTTSVNGEQQTVYLFPTGTKIFLSDGDGYASATNIATGEVVARGDGYPLELTLPADGIFEIKYLHVMWNDYDYYYVSASGTNSTEPSEPEQPATPAEQPSDWALEQVNAGIEAGIVPASLQSKYEQAATRAEFCALAAGLYETVTGSEITDRATFTDTTDENVEKMAALGVVNGTGGGKFEPNAQLTREEAATMLSRLADTLDQPLTAQAPTFADNSAISDWAYGAVGQMQATGVMNGVGDNEFAPSDDYTREQSIVTIMRLYDIVK